LSLVKCALNPVTSASGDSHKPHKVYVSRTRTMFLLIRQNNACGLYISLSMPKVLDRYWTVAAALTGTSCECEI